MTKFTVVFNDKYRALVIFKFVVSSICYIGSNIEEPCIVHFDEFITEKFLF